MVGLVSFYCSCNLLVTLLLYFTGSISCSQVCILFVVAVVWGMDFDLLIVGGGLAGSEAALLAAGHGLRVMLWDMKPQHKTPASEMPWLGELVCSNSLRSEHLGNAVGMLKLEMRLLGSSIMPIALANRVEAGQALAVNRLAFAQQLDARISQHPNINRQVSLLRNLSELPDLPVILATGPLTHPELAEHLAQATGMANLHFYDAVAPLVYADSIDMAYAFWGDRYGDPGQGDYLNCPMDKQQWEIFYQALLNAPQVKLHEFEQPRFFEGCLPLEVMAGRGPKTLLFGPMKPVGFTDPNTGKRPYALLQLRREDAHGQLFNLVGCQTKLTHGAQIEVFRLIPALRQASFARLGSIHRNTFIHAPSQLGPDLRLKAYPNIMVAGQLAGVEGYLESAACGLWAGLNAIRYHHGQEALIFPETTCMGGLASHLGNTITPDFQPSNITWGLLPPLPPPALPAKKWPKKEKGIMLARRALQDLLQWMEKHDLQPAIQAPVI